MRRVLGFLVAVFATGAIVAAIVGSLSLALVLLVVTGLLGIVQMGVVLAGLFPPKEDQ
jgi:hypothetical protein